MKRLFATRGINRLATAGVLAIILAGCAGVGGLQRPSASSEPAQATIVIDASHRNNVVMTAMSMLGTPYKYGGSNPEQGFDCSGLVNYAVNIAAHTKLPRNTQGLARASRPVSGRSLRAGDLVFFNTLRKPNSHVGIYLGNGQFINAPSSGGQVRIDSLANPYFAARFDGGRTFFND